MSAWSRAAAGPAQALTEAVGAEFRCDGTWFPGVNVFPNDASGAIASEGAPPLAGSAIDFIADALGFADIAWDAAQISVCYPGYPRQGPEETDAAFRYRTNRDAAHVDGLLREPPSRRRRLGETHGFILGMPLAGVDDPGASPLVVWEGSHEIMRDAFKAAFDGVAPAQWGEVDITETYQETRKRCFDVCPRVAVSAPVGGAYVLHRLSLHGVAPWTADAGAPPRTIAYFRPDGLPGADPSWWLENP